MVFDAGSDTPLPERTLILPLRAPLIDALLAEEGVAVAALLGLDDDEGAEAADEVVGFVVVLAGAVGYVGSFEVNLVANKCFQLIVESVGVLLLALSPLASVLVEVFGAGPRAEGAHLFIVLNY